MTSTARPGSRTVSPATVRAFQTALGSRIAGEAKFDPGSRALYATDSSNYRQVPIGVVWPRSANDIIQTVRLCHEYQLPILPRGGGTSLAGQCCNVAVVIDTSRHFNALIEIDAAGRTARLQPGMVLDDLQRAVSPYGLMYGPDPATHGWCTFGGMIGNDSCGVHSVVAGLTSDNVEAMDVLTSDGARICVGGQAEIDARTIAQQPGRRGEIYDALLRLRDRHAEEIRRRFPRIPRRVSGYNLPALLPEHGFNLARALVGTEGTCVTVLEATVRLVDAPRTRVLLVLGYDDIFRAADDVMPILEAKPIGVEGLDELIVENLKSKVQHEKDIALLPEGRAWLLVEFGANTAADGIGSAEQLARRLGRERTPTTRIFTDPRQMRMVWSVRESALGATAFVPGEAPTWEGWEDAAVPPERIGAYLREFRSLQERYGFRGALYGHFGQGCVHTRTNFDLQTPSGITTFRTFLDEAADLVVSYGGSLSGEHGDGQSRAELLPKMFGSTLVQAFREFKRIWDPAGLMNPGKVVDAYAITENLRLPGYKPRPATTHFHLSTEGGMAEAGLRCVGVGKCRKDDHGTMCPSYMVTGEEQHSTRGRARLLHEMLRGDTLTDGWRSNDVKDALDLCLACKACKEECPVSVDMATYKAEFLAHYYAGRARPLRALLFGYINRLASYAALVPGIVNGATAMRVIMEPIQTALGIASARQLPPVARQTLRAWARKREQRLDAGSSVVVWPDTFTNYFHPEVGRAAIEVLEQLGYQVSIPSDAMCCGRPLYDFGLLDPAKDYLERIFRKMALPLRDRTPIVVLEPSCFAVFRDEALNLFPHRADAQKLSRQVVLFDRFIRQHVEEGRFSSLGRRLLVHGHCHQKALVGMDDTSAVASAFGSDATLLDAGCCGMAGAFGFEARHYDVSLQIGERVLLPAVRSAASDTLIVADGFSCREQIAQTTGRRAHHLAEIARLAIG